MIKLLKREAFFNSIMEAANLKMQQLTNECMDLEKKHPYSSDKYLTEGGLIEVRLGRCREGVEVAIYYVTNHWDSRDEKMHLGTIYTNEKTEKVYVWMGMLAGVITSVATQLLAERREELISYTALKLIDQLKQAGGRREDIPSTLEECREHKYFKRFYASTLYRDKEIYLSQMRTHWVFMEKLRDPNGKICGFISPAFLLAELNLEEGEGE